MITFSSIVSSIFWSVKKKHVATKLDVANLATGANSIYSIYDKSTYKIYWITKGIYEKNSKTLTA